MTPTFTATIFYARVNAQERAGNLAQSLEEHGIRAGVVFDPDVGDLVEFSGQGAPTPKSFEDVYLLPRHLRPALGRRRRAEVRHPAARRGTAAAGL
jgi:hypothetical protein